MTIRTLRFAALILTALTLGLAFCHTLEMPAKMAMSGEMYVQVQAMYAYFNVGMVAEIGAVMAAGALAFLLRRRPPFMLTAIATGFLAAALMLWAAAIAPVNSVAEETARNAPQALPAVWLRLRARWEFSHVAHFVLLLVGFGTLVYSVLAETHQALITRRRTHVRHPHHALPTH